jgi:hypothetical protein
MKNKILNLPSLLLVASSMAASVNAEDATRTYTDPANADADYMVQGEYSGTLAGEKIGVQVIALGDGAFDLVSYGGGLPGDGWDRETRFKANGLTKDGITTFENYFSGASIENGEFMVSGQAGVLPRIVRKSSTLGMQPPKGAVILFDGSSTAAFVSAEMTDDKLLKTGVTSKQLFANHRIHIEFRTPYNPFARGQQRGNAGLYVQGRYEAQILDSFGLEGEMDEAGGIYSIKASDFNACFPPLTWQTYDVDFTVAEFANGEKVKSARMTVMLNGFVIQDDVELTHATPASPLEEGKENGPVYLQDHGNPVVYRNIWVVEN